MLRKMMGRVFFLAMVSAMLIMPLAAEDGSSMDDLFGESADAGLFGSDMLVEEAAETDLDLDKLLLSNEEVLSIGGSYSFSVTPGWTWFPDAGDDTGTLSTSLGAKLFFDARPDHNMRIFGKAEISYPFEESTVRSFDDIVSIKELFSDFNIDDTVFFRVGKQTINWGVGYFFSPADLLNLSKINPLDPEADIEGPVAVKMNLPVGIDNLYGYVVIPDGALDITDLAVAGKYEKVLGTTEVGFGAYYRDGQTPAAMVTVSSGIGDVSLFGEGVVKYGFDDGSSWTDNGRLYFSGTAGALYAWTADESDFGVSFSGQYYYNGDKSAISSGNQQYGAANLSVSFTDTLSAGVLWSGNMGDLSGLVWPTVSWSPDDYVSIALGVAYTYGDIRSLAATLEFSLGGSNF